jgi:predicted  nucleic acid-binding Zn-ribbon protein
MQAIINHAFELVITGLATVLVMYFKDMKNDVKNMSRSMIDMNVKLEKVITDQSWHKEEIKEIKQRISALEE